MTLEEYEGGTRMTTVSTFLTAEQLEKMLAMGMEEGMRLAMGQIDALLHALAQKATRDGPPSPTSPGNP